MIFVIIVIVYVLFIVVFFYLFFFFFCWCVGDRWVRWLHHNREWRVGSCGLVGGSLLRGAMGYWGFSFCLLGVRLEGRFHFEGCLLLEKVDQSWMVRFVWQLIRKDDW